MAKDPAMLWYWSDWNSGTAILNRFLKGCYMDLLHAQFNSGHLSLSEIKMILGNDFSESWPILQKKFKTDPDGNFFNERLEVEKIKRANFTATRRKNLEGKTSHMDNHMDQLVSSHTDQRMENENINRIIDVVKDRGVQGRKEDIEFLLNQALGEIYLDQEQIKWPNLDFEFELETFRNKVRGSPDDYTTRDASGIRLAFQYQLRNSKGKRKNGVTTNKSTEHINSLVEGFKRRNGGAASG